MAHDRYVELERHPLGGFGFSVIGGVDTHLPPMVCALVQNGSAQLTGKVFAGDVILEVNGQPITHCTTNQVVESIRNTQDNLTLRLRDDPGARERARPYLRKFSVADPKLAICQARLKRSASAPQNPRNRAHTDQLPRKNFKKKEEKTMQKGTSTSTDDVRTVGRMSLIGLEEGVDGIFSRRRNDQVVQRVITEFPVHNNNPLSKTDKMRRPESYRKSYPNEVHRTSRESLPKNCINCGQPIDSTKDIDYKPSTESSVSEYLTCKKCGHVRKYSAGGSSLPGTPYSGHRKLETSPFALPSKPTSQSPTKLNGNLNHSFPHGQMHGDNELQTLNSKGTSTETNTILNGGLKTEQVADKPSGGSPPDSAGRQYNDLHYESPSALAKRLFNLDGFSREEVASELCKNTTYGKLVASEYVKFFDFKNESITEALQKFLKAFHLTGETQERERILIPFSKRYQESNNPDYGSEDATHTLVCAVLLLNSDLHGENMHKKMTQAQFIDNLAELCDGKDFPKDLLKAIYQEIKAKRLEGFGVPERTPTPTPSKKTLISNGSKGSHGNPFIEIQASDTDKVYREGLLYRKVTMGSEGKKTSAWKRKWMPFYATLKGMILFLHKSDEMTSPEHTRNCLGVHHSLASRATDYIKKPCVFRFVTADWREFLFQAKNQNDMNGWIEAINLVAATYSAPPLPAPVGSCKKFQRPVLPFSRTQLTLTKQLEHHEAKSKEAEEQLIQSLQSKPTNGVARELEEWQEKHEFLEYEYKRYKMYVNVLNGSKLESKLRDKPRGSGRSVESIMLQMKRCSSLGDLDRSSGYKGRNVRESYFMAIYK